MLTSTEKKIAETLGISVEDFARSRGAQAERPALNDQVESTYRQIARMARGLSLSTNVLLSAAADRALRALDAGRLNEDDYLHYDGGVAFHSRNAEHPSTSGLLLNITAADRRRVAMQQNGGADAAVADDYSAPNET